MAGWFLLTGLGMGCVADRPQPGRPAPVSAAPAGVQELNVLAIPVAVDLDGRPGVDGFMIKIYASNRKRPKPLLLEEGQLEILMFEGIPPRSATPPVPLRVWKYTAAELRQFEIRSSIGSGYQLALSWGEAVPAGNKISVVARYIWEGGSITSAPSIIAVALK